MNDIYGEEFQVRLYCRECELGIFTTISVYASDSIDQAYLWEWWHLFKTGHTEFQSELHSYA